MGVPTKADREAADQLIQTQWPDSWDPQWKMTYQGIAIDEMHRWELNPEQVQRYLKQMDAGLISASGLNDLLTGAAPTTVLSSSKAINALIETHVNRMMARVVKS